MSCWGFLNSDVMVEFSVHQFQPSSYWVVSSSLDVMVCAITLLEHTMPCLVSVPGRPALFWGEMEWAMDLGEGETGQKGGRRNCSWHVIYERRIKEKRISPAQWLPCSLSENHLNPSFTDKHTCMLRAFKTGVILHQNCTLHCLILLPLFTTRNRDHSSFPWLAPLLLGVLLLFSPSSSGCHVSITVSFYLLK